MRVRVQSFFCLFFAPSPHWFSVFEIPEAVVFPSVVLERVERLEFVFGDDAVPGHLRYRNESGAGELRSQHASEQVVRPERNEPRRWRSRLAAVRSSGCNMSRGQPLTSDRGSELYRLTVEHRAASVEPLGLFLECHIHTSRLPGCDGWRRNASSSTVGLSVVVRPVAPTCRGYAGQRGWWRRSRNDASVVPAPCVRQRSIGVIHSLASGWLIWKPRDRRSPMAALMSLSVITNCVS